MKTLQAYCTSAWRTPAIDHIVTLDRCPIAIRLFWDSLVAGDSFTARRRCDLAIENLIAWTTRTDDVAIHQVIGDFLIGIGADMEGGIDGN